MAEIQLFPSLGPKSPTFSASDPPALDFNLDRRETSEIEAEIERELTGNTYWQRYFNRFAVALRFTHFCIYSDPGCELFTGSSFLERKKPLHISGVPDRLIPRAYYPPECRTDHNCANAPELSEVQKEKFRSFSTDFKLSLPVDIVSLGIQIFGLVGLGVGLSAGERSGVTGVTNYVDYLYSGSTVQILHSEQTGFDWVGYLEATLPPIPLSGDGKYDLRLRIGTVLFMGREEELYIEGSNSFGPWGSDSHKMFREKIGSIFYNANFRNVYADLTFVHQKQMGKSNLVFSEEYGLQYMGIFGANYSAQSYVDGLKIAIPATDDQRQHALLFTIRLNFGHRLW